MKTLLALNIDKKFTTLNIGTGNTSSVNEIVNIICKIANKKLKIKRAEAKDFGINILHYLIKIITLKRFN